MSIPALFEDNTVGNLKVCSGCVFEEKETNLFPRSLIDATIQDSGIRERKDELNQLVFNTSNEPNIVIIILDANIKDNVVILIVHIHSFNNPLKTMFYNAINITSTEAKIFALRYGIN